MMDWPAIIKELGGGPFALMIVAAVGWGLMERKERLAERDRSDSRADKSLSALIENTRVISDLTHAIKGGSK